MFSYPIVLDLSGRLAVVVGFGEVGRRKATGLIEAGAQVLAVDPDPALGEAATRAGVTFRPDPYRSEHLNGAVLAFASATPEVNRAVVADARTRGILVNTASESGGGDFALPAVHRSGSILLSVSTSGAGPALAATLRDRVAITLGPSLSGLASLIAELRPMAFANIRDEAVRRLLLRDWAHPRWFELWETEGPLAVRTKMLASLEMAAARRPGDERDPSTIPPGLGSPHR